jgi:transposase
MKRRGLRMEQESVPDNTSAILKAEEGEVIQQEEWGAIRTLYERGVTKKGIARELGLDIKTVRKWISRGWKRQQRRRRGSKLDRWAEFLRGRAPEVGFNAAVLIRELKGLGYEGSYQTIVKHIRPWREEWCGDLDATPRFETQPGEQAQVDWGTTKVWFGELLVRVRLFVMVLGYSRRIFAKGYYNERIDSLLDAHSSAFEHFGGRTEKILYDNPRTIVLEKDETSGTVKWNAAFKDRMDFYGVEVKLCRYYRARTKGKVESGVKYVKRNALAGRKFNDLSQMNESLLEWCVDVADERIHGTTHERPSERFARAEAQALTPVGDRIPAPRERVETRVVPADTYVTVETNRYPVQPHWVGQSAAVRVTSDKIIISCDSLGSISYQRLVGKHQVARWEGPPRKWPRSGQQRVSEPPRFDPAYWNEAGDVQPRPLGFYEEFVEEAAI